MREGSPRSGGRRGLFEGGLFKYAQRGGEKPHPQRGSEETAQKYCRPYIPHRGEEGRDSNRDDRSRVGGAIGQGVRKGFLGTSGYPGAASLRFRPCLLVQRLVIGDLILFLP